VETLGLLDDVPAKSGMPVTPVLGWLPEPLDVELSSLQPNKAEIHRVFAVPVTELLKPQHWGEMGKFPYAFRHPIVGEGKSIWGLTGYLTQRLLPMLTGT